jgi:signal peptidase I
MDLAQPEALDLLTHLLSRNTAVRFTVTGDSMRPFLAGGETVLLRRVLPAEIRRGDLLLCRQAGQAGGRLLLHRVVRIRRRTGLPALIQTQGDALRTPDAPVPESQVVGRVSAVARTRAPAEMLSLDTRIQRLRNLTVALRQLGLRRVRGAAAALLRPPATGAPLHMAPRSSLEPDTALRPN